MSDKIVVHYNKAHNVDQTIPPWVCKHKGVTHYVSHVTVEPGVGFCTKEAPEHASTKAAILLKGTLVIDNNEAIIKP